ncbi:Beta-1,3-N-acetylglucosaminyltransferase radical fringe [Liparis tanakae]|uniref:Beta-1,3-N-acetylglucosaminyltransferase radical fringe n=1 Tax=Liparis tanakae TaxID=230148 RepID=A0A4Z2G969_9TELE|nr:Beta-1,3-N-acetylglucosaminyltransferase radical fringe [Liparis tanakae]
MHIAPVGVNKFCFLFSLAFCGLLLLLIPALQPPARQVELPQPRPQGRPARAGLQHRVGVPGASVHAAPSRTEGTGHHVLSPKRGMGPGRGAAPPTGKAGGPSGYRSRDPLDFKDIFIAVKTTRKYHKSRLELLIQTWLLKATGRLPLPDKECPCGEEELSATPLRSDPVRGDGGAPANPLGVCCSGSPVSLSCLYVTEAPPGFTGLLLF